MTKQDKKNTDLHATSQFFKYFLEECLKFSLLPTAKTVLEYFVLV